MRDPQDLQQIQPSFSLKNRLGRVAWGIVHGTLYRWSPRPCFAWRAWVLKLFGAKIAQSAKLHRRIDVWAPWNLTVGTGSIVGDRTTLYSQGEIRIGTAVTISQGAHLCAGTHDYNDPAFPLITKPVVVHDHVWVAAEAFIHPGVTLAEGCVIGARSVVTRDTEAWTVYSGFPANKIGERQHFAHKMLS